MIYGSVCSGIEAATVAWHPLGWTPAFFSEIDKFPRAVLNQHYPDTPLHGDFTTIQRQQYGPIDILVGGTPCQSFSVSGLRKGMADHRGNLALEYLRLAARKNPRWIVWENVPGVLSSHGGRDFGSFLGGLVKLGFGFAYRVLDAQYFGVAQRRRRVFVVGYFGDWRPPAAVLFESESLSWHPAPRRNQRRDPETATADGTGNSSEAIKHLVPDVCGTFADGKKQGGGRNGQDAYNGRLIPWCFQANSTGDQVCAAGANIAPTFTTPSRGQPAVAFHENQRGEVTTRAVASALSDHSGKPGQGYAAVLDNLVVRRLTPRECERLQGFPDDYTAVPWRGKPADKCPDSPRYTALGNTMAVPVMHWIGRRIQMVNDIIGEQTP